MTKENAKPLTSGDIEAQIINLKAQVLDSQDQMATLDRQVGRIRGQIYELEIHKRYLSNIPDAAEVADE